MTTLAGAFNSSSYLLEAFWRVAELLLVVCHLKDQSAEGAGGLGIIRGNKGGESE